MGNYIAEKLNIPIEELPYERMISDEIREKLGNVTFASCTDGNHGRGVAWVGQMLQQEIKIFMPKGSGSDRVENIEALGAEVTVIFLGERPGLASSESLSAYMTYKGYIGAPETIRSVVSNIYHGGTNPVEAGAHIADVVRLMLQQKASGLDLKL